MTRYMLAIYRDDRQLSEEDFQRSYDAVNALFDEVKAAGAWVFDGGFNPSTPTVVRSVDGEIVTTDGPYTETKEWLGGLWVVEVDDREAALAWAAKLAAACRRPIEVRRFEDDEATVEELFEHLSTS